MSDDLFEDVLDVEDNFYQEGFDAGVADGQHAGLVEGKIFGIERGYDKALELGKLHGRALVWKRRQQSAASSTTSVTNAASVDLGQANLEDDTVSQALASLTALPKNTRLEKNIEALLALTDSTQVPTDNTDESVEKLEDLTAKATTKAKVIATTVGEPFETTPASASSIEDSNGLSARQ